MPGLDREEYIEQAYFFQALAERLQQNLATQDLLANIKQEVLSITKLPMAIDFLAAELNLRGVMAPAMHRLAHYFAPFQTFIIEQAENDRARFDFTIACQILHSEAAYRAQGPDPQGLFLFQFETLARNRLGYDRGLTAMAGDPLYDEPWRAFIRDSRRRLGVLDVADLVYLRSAYYAKQRGSAGESAPPLFGEKEGRIALAHRRKDPLLFFAALQRHLGYPQVPRPRAPQDPALTLPGLLRRLERLEQRIKLLEEEQKGGIDITKFYAPKPPDSA
jgi:hypothetical protein